MKQYAVRLALTFAGTLAADLLGLGFYRAFYGGSFWLALGLAFGCAFPSLSYGFFADEKSWPRRVGYCCAMGFAGVLSAAVIMGLFP